MHASTCTHISSAILSVISAYYSVCWGCPRTRRPEPAGMSLLSGVCIPLNCVCVCVSACVCGLRTVVGTNKHAHTNLVWWCSSSTHVDAVLMTTNSSSRSQKERHPSHTATQRIAIETNIRWRVSNAALRRDNRADV